MSAKKDTYTLWAARHFGVRPEHVTKEQRNYIKKMAHAASYTAGPEAFKSTPMPSGSVNIDLDKTEYNEVVVNTHDAHRVYTCDECGHEVRIKSNDPFVYRICDGRCTKLIAGRYYPNADVKKETRYQFSRARIK